MEEAKLDITNVFVKFLPANYDDSCLHNLFKRFGRIVSAKVMVDPHTWNSLGYGFVKFNDGEEAENAIREMTGFKIDNKTLMCKLSNTFTFTTPNPNIYIKPLPPYFTEDSLWKMFCEYGAIQTVKIVRDRPNDVIGLVRYEEVGSALHAIHSTHGMTLLPSWRPLTVKYAESEVQRAVRKSHLSPPSPKRQYAKRDQSTNYVATNPATPDYTCAAPVYFHPCVNYEFVPFVVPVLPVYPVTQPVLPPYAVPPAGWYNSYSNIVYPGHITT